MQRLVDTRCFTLEQWHAAARTTMTVGLQFRHLEQRSVSIPHSHRHHGPAARGKPSTAPFSSRPFPKEEHRMICPILRRVATTTMIAVATLGAALTVLAPAGDAQQPRESIGVSIAPRGGAGQRWSGAASRGRRSARGGRCGGQPAAPLGRGRVPPGCDGSRRRRPALDSGVTRNPRGPARVAPRGDGLRRALRRLDRSARPGRAARLGRGRRAARLGSARRPSGTLGQVRQDPLNHRALGDERHDRWIGPHGRPRAPRAGASARLHRRPVFSRGPPTARAGTPALRSRHRARVRR